MALLIRRKTVRLIKAAQRDTELPLSEKFLVQLFTKRCEKKGAKKKKKMINREDCPLLLATVDSLRRTKVMEVLLGERVVRKSLRVLEMFKSYNMDWNQTLYAMAAYALAAPKNSEPAQKLTQKVAYNMCLRERNRLHAVEAILLGASGLLEGEYYDNYIVSLQEEFDYLAAKYSIVPMRAGEWFKKDNFPAGNPVMRLVQLAALVVKESFSFDALVKCQTIEQVENLLNVEVSEYWQTHFTLQGAKSSAPKRIGRDKMAMMAINMVVPMQVAYAHTRNDNKLKESAMELLDSIAAEHNRVVARWTGAGVPCRSAYDSQALIELQAMCNRGECEACPIEKQLRKR